MKLFILITILLMGNHLTVRAQDTLITTNLKVYYGQLVKEDSSHAIFIQIAKNDSIKHYFSITEVLQIKLKDGTIKYYNDRTIIVGHKNVNNPNYYRHKPLKLRKFTNYTFQMVTGDTINATLLIMDGVNYLISENEAKVTLIYKHDIISFKRFSDTLNRNKMLPVTNDYLFNHKLHDNFDINRILKVSNDIEISTIASKANKKLKAGKIVLLCGIAPASLVAFGLVTFAVNSAGYDQDVFETGVKLFGTGIVTSLPFLISGVALINKGKKINKQAIDLHNQRF